MSTMKNVLIIAGSALVLSAISYGIYEYITVTKTVDLQDAQIKELNKQIEDSKGAQVAADYLARAILNRYELTQTDEVDAEEVANRYLEKRAAQTHAKPTLATVDGVPVFSIYPQEPNDIELMNAAYVRAQLKKSYIEGVAAAANRPVEEVYAIFERYPEATEKLLDGACHTAAVMAAGTDGATTPDELIGQAIHAMIDADPEVAELNAALAELIPASNAAAQA